MVQAIPFTVKDGAQSKELVLLEFQGEFEHSELSDATDYKGLELGKLATKGGDNYELAIGNQLLRGKRESAF